MQLVSKISNLCDPDPPTSQTDRHTDNMQSHASRGKNVESIQKTVESSNEKCGIQKLTFMCTFYITNAIFLYVKV